MSPQLRRTPWAAHPLAAHGTHTTPENHMSPIPKPIQCRNCGSAAGPFVRLPGRPLSRRPLCEDCHDAQDGQR